MRKRIIVGVLLSLAVASAGFLWLLRTQRGEENLGPNQQLVDEAIASFTTTTSVLPTTTTAAPIEVVRVLPGDNLQRLIEANQPGTAYLLAEGFHRRLSVVPKDGDRFIGEAGAVVTGENSVQFAFSGEASRVVIEGLIIEQYVNPAQRGAIDSGGSDWTIRNNEIRYNAGAGVTFRSGFQIIDNFIHHNGQIGILGRGSATVIEGNEISFNNFEGLYDPAWEAGGTKFIFTTDLLVRNNYVHDNLGPGLWTDNDNVRTVYEGNVVIDNSGPGIIHEISYEAVIRNNRVESNAHGFYVGGILIANSSAVEVYGNVLARNDGGVIGIHDLREPGALGHRDLLDLWVHDNTVSYTEGYTGIRVNSGDETMLSEGNNRYEANTYALGPRRPFQWGTKLYTIDGWRDLGHDLNGDFG